MGRYLDGAARVGVGVWAATFGWESGWGNLGLWKGASVFVLSFSLPHQVVNRRFGNVKFLRQWPRQEMVDFYQLAKTMGTEAIDKTLAARSVQATHTAVIGWAENGLYMPLDAWAVKGFDRDTIIAKARPEDKKVCSIYGWTTYRAPSYCEKKGEDHKRSDQLSFKQKNKTRALKHRRTDESEPAAAAEDDDSNSSFSSESSASESEEQVSQKPTKPKAKAKASASEKRVAKKKAEAEKAKKKLDTTLGGLRSVVRHELIFDVADEALWPVKANIKQLQDWCKALDKVASSGADDDGIIELANAFDHKTCNVEKGKLKKALSKLERKKQRA